LKRRQLLLTLASAVAAKAQATRPANPWKASFLMGDQIFPSYILATSTLQERASTNPLYLGDPDGLIGAVTTNPGANTRVKLEVKIDRLSANGTYQGVLPNKGEKYAIFPKIRYPYEVVARFDQIVPANVTLNLYLNGKHEGQRTSVVRVHSISDCVHAVRTADGKLRNMPWMYAAYVNENHPAIDQILSDALDTKLINRFVGYLGSKGTREVYQQVFAVWDVFQRRGFRYSTIHTTPTSGADRNLYAQTVRLVDDSLKTSQANCMDGSVLFASVLRRVGIDPFLVLIPNHAFLGFYLDKEHKTTSFLETTRMGTIDLDQAIGNDTTGRALESIASERARDTASYKSFVSAVRVGLEEYAQHREKLVAPGDAPNYRLVDIARARQSGIMPIALETSAPIAPKSR